MTNILVTGGAGYIGSHTCKALAAAGFQPVVYDTLELGHADAVKWGPLVVGNIDDADTLRSTISTYSPVGVIHFAAYAYVGESVSNPHKYYLNNVSRTLSLLETVRSTGIANFIFSSSCATYGNPSSLPIRESSEQAPINPYGQTKLIGEKLLADFHAAYGLNYVALRYFNACGADPDGELRERHDPETHLIPRALLAAAGAIPALDVFGDDYDTPDGTCVRDYVHVTDLASAHVSALRYLLGGGKSGAFNLGTGTGTSIAQILSSIARVTGKSVPVNYVARRQGDPAVLYADPALARQTLAFAPRYSAIDDVIRTAAPTFGLPVVA